ncbi:hypothetical protein JGUZn3_02460 [Entomobacter blattae]|uniref:Uncharacterized protein n=1 Tax=Entomobacter blattae TaxID=2762277 RepID=A0A7H1NNZ4_9PROT|nr:hypothetical protein JGUZn3_02460 [Entomobacter blattae]
MSNIGKISYNTSSPGPNLERFLPSSLRSKLYSNPNSIIYQIYCAHRENMKNGKSSYGDSYKTKKVSHP